MENYSESDEIFARRLQAQEMGNFHEHGTADVQTPLVNRANENPTVINARLNDMQSARASMYLVFIVYGPQVLASFIVLGMHWDDPDVCDSGHTLRWKWWSLMSAMRMLAFMFMAYFMDYYRVYLSENREYNDRMRSIRNTIEAFGLIWFVLGNMWLFGDDDNICHHATRSHIYNLCVSLLVLNYVQICFPCIIAILLIPIFCFCMPCLIRMLARLQDPRLLVGATEQIIETLPEVVVDASHIRVGQDNTCPICLSEMAIGEAARVLRCGHIFHKQCVDEWLRVNASCPTCRKRIIDSPDPTAPGGNSDSNNNPNNSNSHSNSNSSNNNRNAVPSAPSSSGHNSNHNNNNINININGGSGSGVSLNPLLGGRNAPMGMPSELPLLPFPSSRSSTSSNSSSSGSTSRIGAAGASGAYSLVPTSSHALGDVSTHGHNNSEFVTIADASHDDQHGDSPV